MDLYGQQVFYIECNVLKAIDDLWELVDDAYSNGSGIVNNHRNGMVSCTLESKATRDKVTVWSGDDIDPAAVVIEVVRFGCEPEWKTVSKKAVELWIESHKAEV